MQTGSLEHRLDCLMFAYITKSLILKVVTENHISISSSFLRQSEESCIWYNSVSILIIIPSIYAESKPPMTPTAFKNRRVTNVDKFGENAATMAKTVIITMPDTKAILRPTLQNTNENACIRHIMPNIEVHKSIGM